MPPSTHDLILVCDGLDPDAADYETRLYAAGLDDATVSYQRGLTILDVSREADGFADALASAIADARRAGARVRRVEPDHLVTVPEMARRAGLTRAAVGYYVHGARGHGYPRPVACVTSPQTLWDWAEAAEWLHARRIVGADEVARARAIRDTNTEIERAGARKETA